MHQSSAIASHLLPCCCNAGPCKVKKPAHKRRRSDEPEAGTWTAIPPVPLLDFSAAGLLDKAAAEHDHVAAHCPHSPPQQAQPHARDSDGAGAAGHVQEDAEMHDHGTAPDATNDPGGPRGVSPIDDIESEFARGTQVDVNFRHTVPMFYYHEDEEEDDEQDQESEAQGSGDGDHGAGNDMQQQDGAGAPAQNVGAAGHAAPIVFTLTDAEVFHENDDDGEAQQIIADMERLFLERTLNAQPKIITTSWPDECHPAKAALAYRERLDELICPGSRETVLGYIIRMLTDKIVSHIPRDNFNTTLHNNKHLLLPERNLAPGSLAMVGCVCTCVVHGLSRAS